MQVSVHHWRYMDGWRDIPTFLRKKNSPGREFDKYLVGWHCWVYSDNQKAFDDWMKANMTGKYDCIWRFNSGDPMQSIQITKPEDATMFMLTWNTTVDRFGGTGL